MFWRDTGAAGATVGALLEASTRSDGVENEAAQPINGVKAAAILADAGRPSACQGIWTWTIWRVSLQRIPQLPMSGYLCWRLAAWDSGNFENTANWDREP